MLLLIVRSLSYRTLFLDEYTSDLQGLFFTYAIYGFYLIFIWVFEVIWTVLNYYCYIYQFDYFSSLVRKQQDDTF